MASTRHALLASFAGRYYLMALQFVSTVVISHILTPTEIGIFSLAAADIGLAGSPPIFSVLFFGGITVWTLKDSRSSGRAVYLPVDTKPTSKCAAEPGRAPAFPWSATCLS